MTYVALDDRFPRDDRVYGLTDRAFRLHVAAVCACGEDLTDGVVSQSRLTILRALTKATQRYVNELVAAGLWRPVAAGETFQVEGKSDSVFVVVKTDGYYVEGFLKLNRSQAKVEHLSEVRREPGRRGGVAKSKQLAKQKRTQRTENRDRTLRMEPLLRDEAVGGDEHGVVDEDMFAWLEASASERLGDAW